MKGLFGRDKGPSKEELERQAAEELKAVTGGIPAAWGGPATSEAAPPAEARPKWGREEPEPSAPPRSGTQPTSGSDSVPSSPPTSTSQPPPPGMSAAESTGSDASVPSAGIAPGAASSWGSLGAAVTGSAGAESPFLPPPLTDNQKAHATPTPPEEEEAITGLALSQLADRPGVSGNPEDLAVRKVDPRSAEEMRDRAMREFLENKKQRSRER